MRNNQPVTQREYVLHDDDILVSRTDLKGLITYANPAFIKASGFSYEELMGSPHNLVRHPDMPTAAFENLWGTIKQGEIWKGLVKNRRKNGDFYWVSASITPSYENGQLSGFTSVRIKASEQEIARASHAYRQIREGHGQHLTLKAGRLERRGWRGWLDNFRLDSLRSRLNLFVYGAATLLVTNGVLGYIGLDCADKAFSSTLMDIQIALTILGLVGLAVLGRSLAQAILRPQRSAMAFISQLAAGNLSVQMEDFGNTEMGQMTRLLDSLRKSLRSISLDVNQCVERFTQSATQIVSSNEDLNVRTEQQAAALHETAASMEEFTATVEQNVGNARQASQLSDEAVGVVRESGEVMHQVVETMVGITQASRQMADIISVIDSIAFQTNILALNASVEAARAGEQGRGFAVVASEVRNLAGRSGEAAKQIRQLIDSSTQQINQGEVLVQQAEASISSVVSAVTKVNDIMEEIAAASTEQGLGINQVNQAIIQMEQVTQRNAQLVGQVTEVTKDLVEQTDEVRRSISVFRLSQSDAQRFAKAPTKPKSAAMPHAAATTKKTPQLMEKSPVIVAKTSVKTAPAVAPAAPKSAAPAASENEWEEF